MSLSISFPSLTAPVLPPITFFQRETLEIDGKLVAGTSKAKLTRSPWPSCLCQREIYFYAMFSHSLKKKNDLQYSSWSLQSEDAWVVVVGGEGGGKGRLLVLQQQQASEHQCSSTKSAGASNVSTGIEGSCNSQHYIRVCKSLSKLKKYPHKIRVFLRP